MTFLGNGRLAFTLFHPCFFIIGLTVFWHNYTSSGGICFFMSAFCLALDFRHRPGIIFGVIRPLMVFRPVVIGIGRVGPPHSGFCHIASLPCHRTL